MPQGPNNARQSNIPQPRGGGGNRGGRGQQPYQAPRGVGRGRGGNSPARGGMNANAANFQLGGPAGVKRPREESVSQPGNGGKRPRGGGPHN